jgi:hypothetical protein
MATPSSQSAELALRRRWRGVGRKCIGLKPTFGLALAGLPLSLRALSRQSFELAQRRPQKQQCCSKAERGANSMQCRHFLNELADVEAGDCGSADINLVLVGMMPRRVYGQFETRTRASSSYSQTPVCQHANGPKRNPATASGACIAKPRLYAGFHSMSKDRSSSSNRAGCSAMLT